MSQITNELGQPIGAPVPDWTPCPYPKTQEIKGQYSYLEQLDPKQHAADLYAAFAADEDHSNWTYLFGDGFKDQADFSAYLEACLEYPDTVFYTILDKKTERAIGMASYLRITPNAGTIEVGHIHFSNELQRTPLATEAMYLMMKHAFELGYRRYEWKCDALNARSRRSALRLGFTFEGIFRQALVYKGRNRDTAWFAVIDADWQPIKQAFEQWLRAANFDEQGMQKQRLQDLRIGA